MREEVGVSALRRTSDGASPPFPGLVPTPSQKSRVHFISPSCHIHFFRFLVKKLRLLYRPDKMLTPADISSRITSCCSASSGVLVRSQSASKIPKNCAALLSNRATRRCSVGERGHDTCDRKPVKTGTVSRWTKTNERLNLVSHGTCPSAGVWVWL